MTDALGAAGQAVQTVRGAVETPKPQDAAAGPASETGVPAPQIGAQSTTAGLQSRGAPGAIAEGTSAGAVAGQNTVTAGPAQAGQRAAEADIQTRQAAEQRRIDTLFQLMQGLGTSNISLGQNAEQTSIGIDAITRRAAANGQSWWSGVAGWVDGLDRFLSRTFNINLPESIVNWARSELGVANNYQSGNITVTPIDADLADTVTPVRENFDEGAAADAAAGVYRRESVQPRIAPVVANGNGGNSPPPASVSLSSFVTAVRGDTTLEANEKTAVIRDATNFARQFGDPNTINAQEAELIARARSVTSLDSTEQRAVATHLVLEPR